MPRRRLSRNKANVQRRQRYAQARKAGASPQQARQNRSSNSRVQSFLSNLQAQRTSATPARPSRDIEPTGTKTQRYDNFVRWSTAKRFPQRAQDMIGGWNRSKSKDVFDSYGYRRFYYWYVEGQSDDESDRIAESSDT